MKKIAARPPQVPKLFAKEQVFKVKKREVPIKGIRAARPQSQEKIAAAFMDEITKIAFKIPKPIRRVVTPYPATNPSGRAGVFTKNVFRPKLLKTPRGGSKFTNLPKPTSPNPLLSR